MTPPVQKNVDLIAKILNVDVKGSPNTIKFLKKLNFDTIVLDEALFSLDHFNLKILGESALLLETKQHKDSFHLVSIHIDLEKNMQFKQMKIFYKEPNEPLYLDIAVFFAHDLFKFKDLRSFIKKLADKITTIYKLNNKKIIKIKNALLKQVKEATKKARETKFAKEDPKERLKFLETEEFLKTLKDKSKLKEKVIKIEEKEEIKVPPHLKYLFKK